MTGVMIMALPFSFLFGCSDNKEAMELAPAAAIGNSSFDPVKGAELYCLADSQDQAKEIADMYEIELVDFAYGVATFHTDEPVSSVLDRGEAKGYPKLSVNTASHTILEKDD